MTELLITSKIPGKLIYWRVPSDSIEVTSDIDNYEVGKTGWPKLGQTFKLPEKGSVMSLVTKGHRVGTPSAIYLELWEWDEENKEPTIKLADLDSKTYSAFSTSDTEITWDTSNCPTLEADKAYAFIWRTASTNDSNYYVFRACNISATFYYLVRAFMQRIFIVIFISRENYQKKSGAGREIYGVLPSFLVKPTVNNDKYEKWDCQYEFIFHKVNNLSRKIFKINLNNSY